jgi:hypothetical protein
MAGAAVLTAFLLAGDAVTDHPFDDMRKIDGAYGEHKLVPIVLRTRSCIASIIIPA